MKLDATHRRVESLLAPDLGSLPKFPHSWIAPQSSGRVLRFTDTNYDPAGFLQLFTSHFPNCPPACVNRLTLRELFVTLIRAGQADACMPFAMLGFDCDNGSEFLNTTVESYLRNQGHPPSWTRSRAYKKNDQAHVEQKNFTHVRQLLGYGRYDDLRLIERVNDLNEKA